MKSLSIRVHDQTFQHLISNAKKNQQTLSKYTRDIIASSIEQSTAYTNDRQIVRQISQVSLKVDETYGMLKGLIQALSDISDAGKA